MKNLKHLVICILSCSGLLSLTTAQTTLIDFSSGFSGFTLDVSGDNNFAFIVGDTSTSTPAIGSGEWAANQNGVGDLGDVTGNVLSLNADANGTRGLATWIDANAAAAETSLKIDFNVSTFSESGDGSAGANLHVYYFDLPTGSQSLRLDVSAGAGGSLLTSTTGLLGAAFSADPAVSIPVTGSGAISESIAYSGVRGIAFLFETINNNANRMDWKIDSFTATAIPEPSTTWLLAIVFTVLVFFRRNHQRSNGC
jgi:hypothetical protein